MLIRIVGGWSLFTILTGVGPQLRNVAGHPHRVRRGGSGCVSDALPRAVPVVSNRGAKPRQRHHVDGRPSGGAFAPPIAVLIDRRMGWRYTFAIFGMVGIDLGASSACSGIATTRPITRRSTARNCRSFKWASHRLRKRSRPSLAAHAADPNMLRCSSATSLRVRISVLRHLAADVLHARIRITLKESGCLCVAAAGRGSDGLPDGRRDRGLDHTPHGKRWPRPAHRRLSADFCWERSAMPRRYRCDRRGAAVAFLALASGAHDLTLPVLWATMHRRRRQVWRNLVRLRQSSPRASPASPLRWSPPCSQQMFGSFHAVFYVAAGLYLLGAIVWLFIDPRKSIEA